jgi:ribonucleoside-diphosphate reductase beta chain
MFLDGPVGIARYDKVKYPFFLELIEKQSGYFWRPQEIDAKKDGPDFKVLDKNQQHIFTSNLKRQIVLDTDQSRELSATLGRIVSLPEVETWIKTWEFFETIHSRSYTHIIRGVYSNPSEVFDNIGDVKEIADLAKSVATHYDRLEFCIDNHSMSTKAGLYDTKRALWQCLNSINALEGIRFYVSFACSWAFYEAMQSMESNAKIIKFICRDENLHLAGTQQMLKILPKEDDDFARIKEEMRDEVTADFIDVVNQEKVWADYVMQHGSMIGLNANLLKAYIEWIAHRRMTRVDLKSPYNGGSNPLPWTERWIAGADVQVAPQEVENQRYVVGGVRNEIDMKRLSARRL